jgi:hypothetical protein
MMSFVPFRIHVPVEPNEQEKQKIKIFLSLYPVPLVLEGLHQSQPHLNYFITIFVFFSFMFCLIINKFLLLAPKNKDI